MRFRLPYNCYRVMGIAGSFLIIYIVVIGFFGNTDVTWMMPTRLAASIQEGWPQLPFFAVVKEPINGGKQQETYYTVPTRQFTPQEIARMGGRKPVTKSAAAATSASAAR